MHNKTTVAAYGEYFLAYQVTVVVAMSQASPRVHCVAHSVC